MFQPLEKVDALLTKETNSYCSPLTSTPALPTTETNSHCSPLTSTPALQTKETNSHCSPLTSTPAFPRIPAMAAEPVSPLVAPKMVIVAPRPVAPDPSFTAEVAAVVVVGRVAVAVSASSRPRRSSRYSKRLPRGESRQGGSVKVDIGQPVCG